MERLGRRWSLGIKRLSRKRAEAASLLSIYRDCIRVLRRLVGHLRLFAALRQVTEDGNGGQEDGPRPIDTTTSLWVGLSQEIPGDIRDLYHWIDVVDEFFKNSKSVAVDRRELDRICLFRHKLLVHLEDTPLRRAGKSVVSPSMYSADGADWRIVSHPIFLRYDPLRGQRHRLRTLYPYIPGLEAERNTWERIHLIYRHYNAIPPGSLKTWVRNDLLGRSGLRSDPPLVLATALLTALREYVRLRRL